VSLLSDGSAYLDRAGVRFAVIGAAALSVHGISRSTADVDLMTVDRRVLTREFWSSFNADPDVRPGDFDDPLAGVVRVRDDERSLDVIVAKSASLLMSSTARNLASSAVSRYRS
jgi:predicted nucleotidyltransferase